MSAIQRIGGYLLHAELASGGAATVFLGLFASGGRFRKIVAIKRLHPHLRDDAARAASLAEEARLVARVSHTNVVAMLDVVEANREVLLVMEYVHGESLDRLVRASSSRGTVLAPEIAVAIAVDVLDGLDAAHEARDIDGRPLGLVHRDVSPQNVLVGADGVARVVDFGIARFEGREQVTDEGQVRGKLGYMAPEQLHGRELSKSADIYAASVVLWELLTGQRLFEGDTTTLLKARVEDYGVASPGASRPELPIALNRVVLRGLSRSPDARWPRACDMARALEDALPRAPRAAVAAWVRDLASEALDARGALVSELEGLARRGGDREPSRAARAAAVGAALVATGSLAWFVGARGGTTGATPGAATATIPHEPVVGAPMSAAPPSASLPLTVPPPSSVAHRSPAVHRATRDAAALATATGPACDPPYVLDEQGRKIFKRECL